MTPIIATQQVSPSEGSINMLDSCLKITTNVTHSIHTNICTGDFTRIEHGTFDIIISGGIVLFITAIGLLLLSFIFLIGYDIYNS